MTSPPAGPPTTSRRDAALELVVILAATLALQLFLGTDAASRMLPEMPVIKHAWVLFLFTMALLAWLARRHGGNVAEFGLKPFRPWRRLLIIGVLGFVAAVVLDVITNPIVDAVFGKRQLQQFAGIKGNLPVYIMLVAAAFVFGGLGEELLYRGTIMTRLRALFGSGRAAIAGALIVQAVIFGLVHSYQGLSGIISIGLLAVVDGLIFLKADSNLWPVAIAHGLLDTLGFTLLYTGVMKSG